MDSNRLSHCMMPGATGSCGDGYISETEGEQCDDGNVENNDGCSVQCTIEEGFSCRQRYLYPESFCRRSCNNGVLEVGLREDCDDGNHIAGDGCSNTCKIEDGW